MCFWGRAGRKVAWQCSPVVCCWVSPREERNHGCNCRGLVWGVGPAGGADKQSGRREGERRREERMGRDVPLKWRLKVTFVPLVGNPPNPPVPWGGSGNRRLWIQFHSPCHHDYQRLSDLMAKSPRGHNGMNNNKNTNTCGNMMLTRSCLTWEEHLLRQHVNVPRRAVSKDD